MIMMMMGAKSVYYRKDSLVFGQGEPMVVVHCTASNQDNVLENDLQFKVNCKLLHSMSHRVSNPKALKNKSKNKKTSMEDFLTLL